MTFPMNIYFENEEKVEKKNTMTQNPFVRFLIKPIAQNSTNRHLVVYLKSFITDIDDYVDILFFLYTAKEGDLATFYIDNNGGLLDTGVAISQAFKITKAKVTTVAISIAASSAALIFTAGHIKIVKPVTFVMYHTASYGSVGKVTMHNKRGAYISLIIQNIMNDTYELGLINRDEYNEILEGKDVFIGNSVITERVSNLTQTNGDSNE